MNDIHIPDGLNILPERTCCFTGHRPASLGFAEESAECERIKKRLREEILRHVTLGVDTFITGMARGVDLWAGEIILRLKEEGMPIRLICASPYFGFEEQWSEKWRLLYHSIISGADAVTYVSQTYSQSCFQKRNEWMVDRSSRVIAVFNGSSGGTKNTIDYARKHHCEVIS